MIALLASLAFAGDFAVTSLGGQGVYSQGLGRADADTLLSERLRWTVADGAALVADARFTLDPSGPDTWEQNRVRSLGAEITTGEWQLFLGRHPVFQGGPRIVDGVQALRHAGDWVIGAWGGLAPDLFTTRPMLRPGGGPVVAYQTRAVQASLVGEVLGVADGLDRVGALGQVRVVPGERWELVGRLDVQLTDEQGRMGLADGSVAAIWRPADGLKLDALYDAYSSIRYLETQALDPDLRRFEARAEALGLVDWTNGELVDPSLYQLVGAGASWQGSSAVAPRVGLTSRYLHHPREEDRYARLAPVVGLLGVADRLDLFADFAWTWRGDTGSREEVGLNVVVDPLADGALTLDGSARLLIDPAFVDGKPGWYADLFVDLIAIDDLAVVGGVHAIWEPVEIADRGYGAFLRVQHWLRPRRPAHASTTRLP